MATENGNYGEVGEVEVLVSRAEMFIEEHSKQIVYSIVAVVLVVSAVLGVQYGYLIPREKKAAAALFKGEQYFARD